MSLSHNCVRCQQPLPEQLTDGTCPSCGYASGRDRETPRGSLTPDDRDGKFELGSDPNPTGSHIPATIREEPTSKKFPTYFPDIPNHTDFELVGRGGMGTVYRAIQRPTDRKVAVKVMNAFAADSPLRERFINEVRAHARIQHAGIIPIFEVGDCSHGPYFTMEYQPGGTLAQRLKDGKLDDREAVRMIADAAEAVQAAHSQGIIHRDLKPSNILVDPEGRVRVTDFGLAKHTTENNDFTEKGVIVGTFAYMSPEQAVGDPAKIGKESDIYCLGSTLYQLVTGQVAHKQLATSRATVQSILENPTPAPSKLRRDLCPNLDAAIQKCMASNPADRYGTAEAFARDLRNWLDGEPMLARPLTRGQNVRRRLHRHRAAVAAAILIPFLAVAAIVAKREMEPKRILDRELTDAVATGRSVTLVKEKGLPRWFEWKLGKVELEEALIKDNGAYGYRADIESFLVLVERPPCPNYRFQADIKYLGSTGYLDKNIVSPDQLGYVGVFLDYQSLTTPSGQRVHAATIVSFQDGGDNRIPKCVYANQQSIIEDTSRTLPGARVNMIEPFQLVQPKPPDTDWRTLTIDVNGSGIQIGMNDRDGTSKPIASISRAMLGQTQLLTRKITNRLLDSNIDFPKPFDAGRPIGLFAKKSPIAFKNITITPIAVDPNLQED